MKKDTLLFGAHMSISGGLDKCFERGQTLGCTAIQIFTKSNRQWKAKSLTETEIEKFKSAYNNSSIRSVVAHASYLINIGSANEELGKKSVDSLREELERCELLNIPYLILHPGSRQASTVESCLKLISKRLNEVLDHVKGKSSILLENSAGSGSSVCSTFEQLAEVLNSIKQKKRIGICFDTCHAFAAGYNFSNKKDYDNMWNNFERTLGLNTLKAFHINDSKTECGSRIDRHAHITKGKMGLEPFKNIFNDERFFQIPKILETPYETIQDYIPDIKTILDIIKPDYKHLITNSPFEKIYFDNH